jgi:ATP-dependent Lon protease
MDPSNGEYFKIKGWIDGFMKIPFGNYVSMPVNIDNGIETCAQYMSQTKQTLDNAVYGLNDTKMQIMQLIGQLVSNPSATGTSIAIHGDKGVGKTSIVQDGISKILNRPFAFIPLGGATDSSYLEGHSYTYEGSTCGKIVQILMDCKVMNPVIYFDELDKISDTPKGAEITNILLHLTDTTQNTEFHDKYFSDLHFDVSKCIFIFSYNDDTHINPVLKDRMYTIHAKGYNKSEKIEIARKYLIKKISAQVNFSETDICFTDSVLGHIIDNYCQGESGVRNLKRCIETIYTKLNLCRLMSPGSTLFGINTVELILPCTMTTVVVDVLLKIMKPSMNPSAQMMYI